MASLRDDLKNYLCLSVFLNLFINKHTVSWLKEMYKCIFNHSKGMYLFKLNQK